MQGWSPGQPFPRKAFANVFDRSANTLYEAVVDLNTNTLDSWTQKAGAQPAVYFSGVRGRPTPLCARTRRGRRR